MGRHREWKKLDNARSNIRWEFALAATGFRTDRGRGLSIFCIKVLKIFLGFSNCSMYNVHCTYKVDFLSISCTNVYFESCHLRVACKNNNMTMYFGRLCITYPCQLSPWWFWPLYPLFLSTLPPTFDTFTPCKMTTFPFSKISKNPNMKSESGWNKACWE